MKKSILFLIAITVCFCAFSQTGYDPPQTVNVGTAPNAGNGDNLRNAFSKLNTNDNATFDSLYVIFTRMIKMPQVVQFPIAAGQVLGDTTTEYEVVIPVEFNGYNLVKARLYHGVIAGNRAPTTLLYRNRAGTEVNMTSTGTNYNTDAVINTSYDDLQTGDLLQARTTFGSGTTYPYGLHLILIYQKP